MFFKHQIKIKIKNKIKSNFGTGIFGVIALIIGTGIVVIPLTSWLLQINQSVGESNQKLESVTIAQSEFERLSHMSVNELKNNKDALANQYKVGESYLAKVNLGTEGYFSNGKCGTIPSGKQANCFRDTTITVFNKNGDRLYSSRAMALQAGLYTPEELEALFENMKNTLINNLKTEIDNSETKITEQITNNNTSIRNETTKMINDAKSGGFNIFTTTTSGTTCAGSYSRDLYSYTNENLYIKYNGVNWGVGSRQISYSLVSSWSSSCYHGGDPGAGGSGGH